MAGNGVAEFFQGFGTFPGKGSAQEAGADLEPKTGSPYQSIRPAQQEPAWFTAVPHVRRPIMRRQPIAPRHPDGFRSLGVEGYKGGRPTGDPPAFPQEAGTVPSRRCGSTGPNGTPFG